jgi:hypothetical protein
VSWIRQTKKAVAAFLVGVLGWGTAVVASDSASVTATEWIALATVAVSTLTVYFLTNEPAPDA